MVGLQPERKGTTKKARGKILAGKKGNNPRCNPWHSEPYKPMAGCVPRREASGHELVLFCVKIGVRVFVFPSSETVHDFRLF